jgi:hypothetical protein
VANLLVWVGDRHGAVDSASGPRWVNEKANILIGTHQRIDGSRSNWVY